MSKNLQRILYIEDYNDIVELVTFALSDLGGYDLLYCKSEIEALKKIGEFKPQLILMDVMMPEVDGPLILKSLKTNKEYRKIPVIFITARVQSHEIDEYYAMGVDDIIVKPFDPVSLPAQLSACWEKVNERK